jgi:hypothetical protein
MEGTIGREHSGARAPEFLAWAPLAAIALFTLNNFWLKGRAPVAIAGKLSDFAACFFLPLFFSALLAFATRWSLARRMLIGCATAVVGFSLVKTSAAASLLLDRACAALGGLVAFQSPKNRVDASDLIALPMVALAWLWAKKRDRSFR